MKAYTHPPVRRVVGAAALWCAAFLAGCDDPATPAEWCADSGAPLCASPAAADGALGAVADVRSRVLPALADRDLAAALERWAREAEAALNARDVGRARRAIERARAEAGRVASARPARFPGDAPDLAALELALIQVELLLR